jgi:hypothetical protein
MAVLLSPVGGAGWQFFDNNGAPLAGGLLYTYAAGTSTPLITYTSASGLIANANPIVLDASGRPPNQIWLTVAPYKLVLQTSAAVQIWSQDNISGSVSATVSTESYQTATQGQTIFSGLNYSVGSNNIKIYVNGSKQIVGVNYNETNSSTITFVTGLNSGDLVEFVQ